MFDVSESTGSLSGPSATANQPRSGSQNSLVEALLQFVGTRGAAVAHGVLAEPLGDRGACSPCGVGVALHLAQRQRRDGDPTVAVADRVAGVLPSLVHQPPVGGPEVLEEPVAVAVAVVLHPLDRTIGVRQQPLQVGVVDPPPAQLAEHHHEQRRGVDRPVVRAVAGEVDPLGAEEAGLVHDPAGLLLGRSDRRSSPWSSASASSTPSAS